MSLRHSPQGLIDVAREKGIKRAWLYMFIGQMVAVSYASALFWAVCETMPSPRNPQKLTTHASWKLVWTTIAATIASFGLYWTVSTSYFLYLLLIIHSLLFLPLFDDDDKPSSAITISQLYGINMFLSLVLHCGNSYLLYKTEGFGALWNVLYEHPAMSSVGWDVICCAIIGIIGTEGYKQILPLLTGNLAGSMGWICRVQAER